jgi:flagellar hook-associated protein 3 FlgL
MKISSSYFFDRATSLITQGQASVAQTQTRLATGENLIRPSDEPDAALAIERLQQSVQSQESLSAKLKVVLERYRAQETALGSISNVAIRVKELAVQAANDTLGESSRLTIATEIRALRDQVFAFANSRDTDGVYLFSRDRALTPAFQAGPDGRIVYTGDRTEADPQNTSLERVQPLSVPVDPFARVVRDVDGELRGIGFFEVFEDLAQAVEGGTMPDMQRSMAEIDTVYANISGALADNGARQSALDVQQQFIDENVLRLQTTLADVRDLDYTEAIARMNKQMLALEAAMNSFSRVSQLNLFNFLQG